MGIRNELYGLTGGYAPSGAYSLDVYTRGVDGRHKVFLGEHFFVVGPARYSTTFQYKISAKNTYDGASITDFGEGLHNLNLSGVIGAYHTGPIREPSNIKKELFATNFNLEKFRETLGSFFFNELGLADKPGYFDFFDLIWLLYDARNEYRFNHLKPEKLITANLNASGAEKIYNKASASGLNYLNFENTVLVFNDYDNSRKYEVVYQPNSFEITQSADDPFAWNWNLNFVIIQELSCSRPFIRQILPSLGSIVSNTVALLDGLNFTIQSSLKEISNAVKIIDDVRNLKSSLNDTLGTFNEETNQNLSTFWQNLTGTKAKNQSLRIYLENNYHPNEKLSDKILPKDSIDYTKEDIRHQSEVLETALANIESAILISENEQNSKIYIKNPIGVETWEDLAIYLYGDINQAKDLALLNPIGTKPASLEKIRILDNIETQNTGIIISTNARRSAEEIEINLFGTDLSLSEDRDFAISPDGDLEIVSGLNSLIYNLLDRLQNTRGTIPLHQEWGLDLLPGNVPDHLLAQIGPSRILENLYHDPSVKSVDVKEFELFEDSLNIIISITPQGDNESFELGSSLSL